MSTPIPEGRIRLSQLMPAKSEVRLATEAAEAINGGPTAKLHKITNVLRARLIAQEFVRNGMKLPEAYATVTKRKIRRNVSMMDLTCQQPDVFTSELSNLMAKSDADRDAALNILWSMIHISLLDYFDDHGHILPIHELKKLPRIYQIMLTEVDVTSEQVVVRGDDGKIMVDDTGSPYLRTEQRVKLKLPDKQAALGQLAQIMKWIGPTSVTKNTYIGIGTIMSAADERQKRAERTYEGTHRSIDKTNEPA